MFKIGTPSLVHVYAIDCGLPVATRDTCSGSPSTPTTVFDGGGLNIGASAIFFCYQREEKLCVKHENLDFN